MKFSEQWLREWVNPEIDCAALIAQLTMAGLEVDSTEKAAVDFTGIVVGDVISVEQHPDADKLRVCRVSVGEKTPLQIVCGASNVHAGARVPLATIGANLPGGLNITKSKLRGVVSEGMICSAKELGLAESSNGIMLLPGDAPIGEDIREYLQLNDNVIDIDLTPNRGDCLSIAGIAREVAVLNRCALNELQIEPVTAKHPDTLRVDIQAPQACSQYAGRIIYDVNSHAHTPTWIAEKLRRSGIRSIDPIVDVTNFVMLELGQPMHAFDLDKIDGSLHIRFAKETESLQLLDGKTLSLNNAPLIIADDQKPLALAGIMGGLESGVTKDTVNIFLESAYFDAPIIAKHAKRYGLHSDSSHRFERGVDPRLQALAIERATELLVEIVGGRPGPVVVATDENHLPSPKVVNLRFERIEAVLGIDVAADDAMDIFERLGMRVLSSQSVWQIEVPSSRFDVQIEADLIEEIARIYGYNNIPNTTGSALMTAKVTKESELSINRLADKLVARDYHEAITYSFVDPQIQKALFPGHESLSLINPISNDLSQMRVSLWPGLLQALLFNQNRQATRVRLFETGLLFPEQTLSIAGLASGSFQDEQWGVKNRPLDFYDVKADVETLLRSTGEHGAFEFVACEHSALHPGQSAKILRGEDVVGYLGALHPKHLKALSLQSPVFLFELMFEKLSSVKIPAFMPISKFPANRRDISFFINEKIPYQDIHATLSGHESPILIDIQLFDVYAGSNLPQGDKSMAVSFLFQDTERTLNEEDMSVVINDLVHRLQAKYAIQLRD